MTSNIPVPLDQIRANVAERIGAKLHKIRDLTEGIQVIARNEDSPSLINSPGRRAYSADIMALVSLLTLLRDAIKDDIWMDVEQYASLLARDVIVEDVRQAGNSEPIVLLTGNSMAPTYRAIDHIELIWQADEEGEFIHELWERVEAKCSELDVYLGSIEDDGSIYGVDTSKWEPSEASEKDQPVDSYHEMWSRIDGK